jgi:hypothetical protein
MGALLPIHISIHMVPMYGTCLCKVSNDRKFRVVSEGNDQLVNHESEDSHLGGTSIVEFDGTLGELLLFIEGVPAEINVSVTEVTNEFISSSWNILHEGALKDSDESNHLDKSGGWDGVRAEKGGNTVRVRVEGVTSVVDVSWKVDSCTGDNLSEESKLADAAVLDLNVTKAVETLLVLTGKLSERIEESERSLGTELVLEGHGDSGGLGSLLGRSEGGCGGNKGGDDNRLHFDCCKKEIVRARNERNIGSLPVYVSTYSRRTVLCPIGLQPWSLVSFNINFSKDFLQCFLAFSVD